MKADEFFQRFTGSAAGRTMIEKFEKSDKAASDATRKEARRKLDDVSESALAGVKQRSLVIQKHADEVTATEQLLKEQKQALERERASDRRARYQFDVQRDLLTESLTHSADPAIAAFIETMRGESDRLRHLTAGSHEESTGKVHILTGTPVMVGYSEIYSLKRRIVGVREAIAAAEALKLDVDVDVRKRLEAIENDLPAIKMEMVA